MHTRNKRSLNESSIVCKTETIAAVDENHLTNSVLILNNEFPDNKPMIVSLDGKKPAY